MAEKNDDNTHIHVVLAKDTIVQHYRIIEKIGAGGMGEVYLAEDTKLKRNVALKFLPHHFIDNEGIKKRFQREAQAVAKLNHPNIVTIHEVSEFNGRPFFVMENIDGHSLHYFTEDKSLPIDSVIEFAIQICHGLGEAHRNNIVHRDIKPANIAVDNTNRIKLLDFGLAATESDDKLTKTGSTLGTVAYMSPEQVSGRDIDHRSDLFSLGVVLYELLCGRTPFKKDNEGATLKAIIENNPEPICRYKSEVPDKLQEIISKLIEKDKELRYQSAEGVIADLKRLMYDSQSASYSQTKTEVSSYKGTYLKLAAVVIIIISVIGFMYFNKKPEQVVKKAPVLIVIPFENLGAESDDYFSDGIREEISARLSTVKGLRVISQRSGDKYKKSNESEKKEISIQEIGKETGADYVLEATIRWDKSGDIDRIRITPRLTKTSDSYLMWADNYEQKLVEIFAVQSDIADKIVTALGLTLVETGKSAPEGTPTKNMAAYNYYLRGLEISGQTFRMSDFSESIRMYDSAIALDPNFALAWAQKSINHSNFNFFFTTENLDYHRSEALRAAEKTLELEPNLPSGKIAMGIYHNFIERDYDKALEAFYSAKSEMTSNADLSQAIGIVKMRQGKWEEALTDFTEAIRIDPLTVQRYYYMANGLTMIREFEEADKYIARALMLDPSNEDAAFIRVFMNLLQHGKLEVVVGSFDKLVSDAGLTNISTYELASFSALGLWRFLKEKISFEDAVHNIRELGSRRGVVTQRSPHIVQLQLGNIYNIYGHYDSALIHYDSTIFLLNEIIEQTDEEFHSHAELGLAYALIGEKEKAIASGNTAKEIMSVDDCHW